MSPTPCQTCLVPELRSPEALILRVDRCCSQPTWRKAAERQRYGELLRAVKTRSWLGRPSGLELRTAADGPQTRSLVAEGQRRVRLRVAYDGGQYYGWARVKGGSPLTVAGMLDRALSLQLRQKIFVCGASRTDAGVHAQGQAAHFDIPEELAAARPAKWQEQWQRKLNQQLPGDIRVRNVEDAPHEFHARFSASGKTYVYRLHYSKDPEDPLARFFCFAMPHGWVRVFDLDLLRSAAQHFVGLHDFAHFTQLAKLEGNRSSLRRIEDVRVVDEIPGQRCRVEIDLDGALFRMVRNMLGCMVSAACGRISSEQIDEMLKGGTRCRDFPCLPANGLCLEKAMGWDGGTTLAYDLHRLVPADRWCVTHRDLRFLRQEIRSALRHGQIRPGPEDDASEAYGPSIYTVNEQYIKPVTRQAGKMSWALMRHPDGLECELFISHAWQEGVFEFLKKVRHSWPRTLQTAWCCMLANPQNLDISSFLQSPETSPFAVALAASKVMLVVPNRHQSVYTRLWCSYEAYLSQEDGKTILIAHSSNLSQVLRALIWLALAAIVGLALGILFTRLEAHETFAVPALTILVVGFSLLIDNDMLRRIMHFVGVVLCWICVAHNFGGVFGEFMESYYRDEGIPRTVLRLVHRCYWLLASVAFCVMEVSQVCLSSQGLVYCFCFVEVIGTSNASF
ncbi:unnamed protein product [Cladocopium goreaui]|uniref:tRNA pseudouridine synthase n=1 Tax=Cladocopium goreaui TaxID=2562237 RepID=A0A9P1FNW6_9DINO|nr:unnamed protein product [Cladocopium goreaui]